MIRVETLVRHRGACLELLTRRCVEYEGYASFEAHLGRTATFRKYRAARKTFVGQNLGLVYTLVRKHFNMYVQRFGHEDIVHEGVFGVMRAIDTYEVGVSEFSTYAAWWIRHFIQRAIENRLRTVRIPTYQITRALKINRQPENKRDVEDEEYLKAMLPKLGNTVTDMPAAAVAYDFADFEDLRRVREAMPSVLAPRELEVIVRRFGFSGPSRTLQEVGTELGVTRERVRQIERKALAKLRKALVDLE